MRKSEFFIREFPVVELRVWSDDAKHAAKSYQNWPDPQKLDN